MKFSIIFLLNDLLDSVWDLDNPVVTRIHDGEDPIICMVQVQQKLWMGAGNHVYVFNMASSRREVYTYFTGSNPTQGSVYLEKGLSLVQLNCSPLSCLDTSFSIISIGKL